jgi:hypothetical protein
VVEGYRIELKEKEEVIEHNGVSMDQGRKDF